MEEDILMNDNVEPFVGENENPSRSRRRQRSTIKFPYTDYDSGSKIATAIHGNVGHGECSHEQLAAWTKQSVKSSGFRSQISASKLFGIVEDGVEAGNLKLTELGRRTVDPIKAREAKATAFLNVPLFKELYENYKDGVTPLNKDALEREIESLGVSPKQKAKARIAFENSAKQTGFREAAPNRLVMPATVVTDNESQQFSGDGGNGGNGGDGGDGGDDLRLDPLIMALLRKIPPTKGWPGKNRLRWFRTLAMNVSQVYDDDKNPIELKIELEFEADQEDQNF